MKVICQDRRQKSQDMTPEGRAVSSVASDIDRLLAPKSFEELEALEKQISQKLASNEPIDVDYWEQLLRSLTVWKAKATLKKVYQSVIASRLADMRSQQQGEADTLRRKLQVVLEGTVSATLDGSKDAAETTVSPAENTALALLPSKDIDPDALLKLREEDKALEVLDEKSFLAKVVRIILRCARFSRVTPMAGVRLPNCC